MGFAEDVKAFEKKALTAASNSINKRIIYLFTSVVGYSPTAPEAKWSKGALIDQWFPSVGKSPNFAMNGSLNYQGANSMSRINSLFSQPLFLGKDNIVTFTNSVSYAYRAENLGWPKGLDSKSGWTWTGRVAPYKMVSKAVNDFKGAYS